MTSPLNDLTEHLMTGDNFMPLISKAGGLAARKQFQEFLETAINLALQGELIVLWREQQLVAQLKELEGKSDGEGEGQTTPSGTPEVTATNSQPSQSSASAGIKALLNGRKGKNAQSKS